MLRRLLYRDNETTQLSLVDWAKMFKPGAQVNYNGRTYQAFKTNQSPDLSIGANSIVFACESTRILLFSEARFQYQQLRNGRPGDLFGNADLQVLEEPWTGHATRDLLAQSELDVFATGNSYWINDPDGPYLVRIDASKMIVLTTAVLDVQSGRRIAERLLAYAYQPAPGEPPIILPPTEVAHYKPYPSMENRFVGMSWVTPCLTDIDADDGMTEHKRAAVRNGANLSYVVSMDPTIDEDAFEFFVEKFREDHERPENSGRTLFLGGGADIKTVGMNFEELAFATTQGAGETRIAACAGIPPVIAGLSEGLKGSSLNVGNYSSARRRLSDGVMRPLWGTFAAAMQSLVPRQAGARLWYDDRDIAFLREDVTDQAIITQTQAETIARLITEGYEPDAAVDAVIAGDMSRLKGHHTGLVSVQLQPPGTALSPSNGKGNGKSALPSTTKPALPAGK